MDLWLEQWLDNESARMQKQEARRASLKRSVTRLLRSRTWSGKS